MSMEWRFRASPRHPDGLALRMGVVRMLIASGLLAVVLSACGGPGGGSAPSPYGGGAQTDAPRAAPLATPLPTGDPNVDNYYGY